MTKEVSLSSLQVDAPKVPAPEIKPFQSFGAARSAHTQPARYESHKTSDALANVLSADSSYIERAKTQAREESAKRGLLNTSIGVQAGVGAAIDRALPIAQGDAQAANEAASTNAGFRQQAREQNAARDTAVSTANSETAARIAQQEMQDTASLLRVKLDGDQQLARQWLVNNNQYRIADLENRYQSQIATGGQAADLYNGFLGQVGAMMNNPQMSPDRLKAQVTLLTKQFEASLNLVEAISRLRGRETLTIGNNQVPQSAQNFGYTGKWRL